MTSNRPSAQPDPTTEDGQRQIRQDADKLLREIVEKRREHERSRQEREAEERRQS